MMDFAADFTAIDFETASRRSDSACQLAAVVVRGGQIVDQFKWMIRPEPFYFSQSNIRIHGITPQQVQAEPCFGQLWPEIADRLGDNCLVAHNASFDIGVLLACLAAHRQSIPELHYTCTRSIARRTWPHHRRYGLKPLATWLGIRFRHHDALEDSIACAKILLAAGIDREATSLEDLEKQLRLKRGAAGNWGRRSPTGRAPRKRTSVAAVTREAAALPFLNPDSSGVTTNQATANTATKIDFQRLLVRAEFIRPLCDRRIVFRGPLEHLTTDEANLLATSSGGRCQNDVDNTTDLIVVGPRTETDCDSASSPRIMREIDFLQLIIAS